MKSYKDIDSHIASFPRETQSSLKKLRAAIHKAAPKATEAIKYGIPTFVQDGNIVHFGGYDKHIGFYPGASAIITFRKELLKYDTSKGTIRFPVGKALPLGLITKIVKYQVKENALRKALKKKK